MPQRLHDHPSFRKACPEYPDKLDTSFIEGRGVMGEFNNIITFAASKMLATFKNYEFILS
jgi:hypothetical protein